MSTKMNNDTPDPAELKKYIMFIESNRIGSFIDWPFQDGCSCTPQKMAEAGFYHIPSPQEPDAVKCFVCGKELDGWEPDDDPWAEHSSHSSQCPYLQFKGKKLLVEDVMKLLQARYRTLSKTKANALEEELEEYVKATKEQLDALL